MIESWWCEGAQTHNTNNLREGINATAAVRVAEEMQQTVRVISPPDGEQEEPSLADEGEIHGLDGAAWRSSIHYA